MPEIDAIAELVPHAGAMVLIDEVLDFAPEQIECRAHTGELDRHPLAREGRLPATALAEYGAQAMAIHGTLCDSPARAPRPGRLVALPELDLACQALAEAAELIIRATRMGGSDVGQVYAFEIFNGSERLAAGRATIMFPEPEPAA